MREKFGHSGKLRISRIAPRRSQTLSFLHALSVQTLMNTTRSLLFSLVAIMLPMLFSRETTQADDAERADIAASDLLPKTVVAVAEANNLGSAIEIVLNHPLRRRIETLPVYTNVVKSGALNQLDRGIAAFETSMGKPWQKAIDTLTDGGITIALDPATDGLAILVKSSDVDMLQRLQGFLLAIGQMKEGKLAPIEQGVYRGFTAYALSKDLKLAILGHWMLITNKSELGKSIIDQYLDTKEDSLRSTQWFSNAVAERHLQEGEPQITAYVDVSALRDAGVAKDLFNDKSDNLIAEVLLGGVLANLKQTPFATATLRLKTTGAHLQLTSPHQLQWQPPREYFFGENGIAAAPPLLDVENRLFAISAHRDVSQMWLRSGDLLSDQANEGIAKADTQLTTFFSGRDFAEDILGALESGVQIVGQAQDFSNILPQPATKLPAFAIQFRMKSPDETMPLFRRVFQSFVGFLNVVGAMEGQPQLDLGMETVGDAKLFTATYVAMKDQQKSTDAPINFNFSPSIAFADDRVIFSSTMHLARQLVTKPVSDSSHEAQPANTTGMFDATTLKQILDDNRSQLVANNMLEKGHSNKAAESEIGLLLELVGMFEGLTADLAFTEKVMSLNVRLNVDQE
jgi:hypothetical protein